jgi:RND family efflux transporter MFP subunit
MATMHATLPDPTRPPRPAGPRIRLTRIAAGLACATVLTTAGGAEPSAPAVAAPAAQAAVSLDTVQVSARPLSAGFTAEGTIEAVRQSTIAAQVTGRVVEMRVDAGDRVRQGQVLMRIDAREATQNVAAARAQVAQADALLRNARAQYDRTAQLHEQRFLSAAALDKARADLQAATAQRDATLAAEQGASTSRGFTDVVAPFDGVVAARLSELGEMASLGRPLLSMFDPGSLRVVVNVPQGRLASLSTNGGVRVEVQGLAAPIEPLAIQVLPAADASTHTTRVRLALPPTDANLRPGLFARAVFPGKGESPALLVPERAVVRRSELTAVYVVDPAGAVQLRQVRLGRAVEGTGVEVAAGLVAGDRVALDPVRAGIALRQSAAAPGTKARP